MSVTYILRPGYDSDENYLNDLEINLDRIKEIAMNLKVYSEDIINEYLEPYKKKVDLTIRQKDGEIRQTASGGDTSRLVKEFLRKCVAIYVLERSAIDEVNIDFISV